MTSTPAMRQQLERIAVEEGRPISIVAARLIETALTGATPEAQRWRAALEHIAAGDGVYGAQALEYKNVARCALGLPRLGDPT